MERVYTLRKASKADLETLVAFTAREAWEAESVEWSVLLEDPEYVHRS